MLSVFLVLKYTYIYKHHQLWLRVEPRETKDYWVNPSQFSYWTQGNHLKKFGPRGTKAHWVHPLQFLTGRKAIISRYLDQGALRPIELTPRNLFYVTTHCLHIN